jgi:hypothetical protein
VLKCINNDLNFELNLLEDLNRRKSNLLYELNEDMSFTLSWLKLCEIILPNNPKLAIERIINYSNKNNLIRSKIYNEVYQELQLIRLNDVLFYQPIASILCENFKYYEKTILNCIKELHIQMPNMDINELIKNSLKEAFI